MHGKAKNKPPSRAKYEKEHPTIAVRVSKELKEVLEAIRAKKGDSYAEIIKEGLMSAAEYQKAFDEGFEEGFGKGWNDGKRKNRIWFDCSVCDEPCFIIPHDKVHKEIMAYLKRHGWGHKSCIQHQTVGVKYFGNSER